MNVIVIVADTWRFDYLGCYGNDWIQTPHLDRLAAESVVFDHAYAEGCPTIPTRRALMTGRYTLPFRGWGPLLPEDTTLADRLWAMGIRTALITDTAPMHLPGYGYERGFDFVHHVRGQEFDHFYAPEGSSLDPDRFHRPAYFPAGSGQEKTELPASRFARQELMDYLPQRQHWRSDEDQMAAQVCRAALDYLERRDKKRPFLLWLDCFDPHEPWDPPSVWDPDLVCPYDPDYDGPDIINPVPTYVDGYLTEAELHHIRMLYAEKCTMVDRWLGKVIDRLRTMDLLDDSLIFFLSDHGQPFGSGEHGHGIMRKCRPWPYEELTHIPFMVRLPGATPRRIESFVQTVDLTPTVLDWLGVTELPPGIQGQSLMPVLEGRTDRVRDFAVTGYHNFSWSIVTPEWSYINWLLDKGTTDSRKLLTMYGRGRMDEPEGLWTCTPGSVAETPRENELYDRREDPFQLRNLAAEMPDRAAEMHRRLRDFLLGLKTG